MKKLIFSFVLLISILGFSQNENSTKFAKHQPEKNIKSNDKPIIFINDVEVNYEYFEKMNKKVIDSVFVIDTKKSIEIYGDKGKNGAIKIITKKED
jgi:hypothetical protein